MTTLAATTPAETIAAGPSPSGRRLMSVDALRGFDMFWIIGAEALVHALSRMTPSAPVKLAAEQLTHAPWEGFHFYDLIFPLFVFLMGKLALRLAGGDVKTLFDDHVAKGMGEMMISIVGLLLAFWFVHFLYQRKIFLRL